MPRSIFRLFLFMLGGTLCACATSSDTGTKPSELFGTPNPHVKIGKPYQVKGVWYTPQVEPDYDRFGPASWYGPGFHGRLTANGEIFDENRLTAAHPTLPLPSIIEVTNPKNGKNLRLRVNDRGPFANDRILDLSKEAARRLGTYEAGVATVRVRYLGPARIEDAIVTVGTPERGQALYADVAPQPAPVPGSPQPEPMEDLILAGLDVDALDGARIPRSGQAYFVQVGAYSSTGNAAQAAERLSDQENVAFHGADRGGRTLTLVRLGPYAEPRAAEDALIRAQAQGFGDAHIVEEIAR